MTSCGHWVAPEHLSASVCKSQCRILMFLQICNSVCLIMQKVPCVLVKISVSYLSASFNGGAPETKQKSIQRVRERLLHFYRHNGSRGRGPETPPARGRHWGSHTARWEPGLGFGSQIRPHEAEKVGRRGQRDDRDPSCAGHGWGQAGQVWKKEKGEPGQGDRQMQRPELISPAS